MVNVASIPKLSPFRYPGGKTWLVPYLRRWLSPQVRQKLGFVPTHPTHLIEPFVGGGIISLTASAENFVDHVTMVEIDADVAAVWQTVLHEDDWAWLAHKIITFDLTHENVKSLLVQTNLTCKENAFRTIVRNRVNRGGILAEGVGLLKQGENGKGIKSRWYPSTLERRIQKIVKMRERITFILGDGIDVLRENVNHTDAVFFIDPPYTIAGKKAGERLYRHFKINHEELFRIVRNLRGDFLMTYDDVEEVRELTRLYNFDTRTVPTKNTHNAHSNELLIGPNLSWLPSTK